MNSFRRRLHRRHVYISDIQYFSVKGNYEFTTEDGNKVEK